MNVTASANSTPRGLGLIQNLADSVEIQKSDAGTNVHIEMAYVTARKPAFASPA
jgi:anti-sigma regulatory factor (Ser/Thr protein kinase)